MKKILLLIAVVMLAGCAGVNSALNDALDSPWLKFDNKSGLPIPDAVFGRKAPDVSRNQKEAEEKSGIDAVGNYVTCTYVFLQQPKNRQKYEIEIKANKNGFLPPMHTYLIGEALNVEAASQWPSTFNVLAKQALAQNIKYTGTEGEGLYTLTRPQVNRSQDIKYTGPAGDELQHALDSLIEQFSFFKPATEAKHYKAEFMFVNGKPDNMQKLNDFGEGLCRIEYLGHVEPLTNQQLGQPGAGYSFEEWRNEVYFDRLANFTKTPNGKALAGIFAEYLAQPEQQAIMAELRAKIGVAMTPTVSVQNSSPEQPQAPNAEKVGF
ncbi:MAG: hypothetical protein ACLQF0_17025 [Dissulfurispiraceae bacterium]